MTRFRRAHGATREAWTEWLASEQVDSCETRSADKIGGVMRVLVAVMILGAAGLGQDPDKCVKEFAAIKTGACYRMTDYRMMLQVSCPDTMQSIVDEYLKTNRRLLKGLSSCVDELSLVKDATKQCEAEVDQPRLPLTVNPGECYRIGGDMSMRLIECPKE